MRLEDLNSKTTIEEATNIALHNYHQKHNQESKISDIDYIIDEININKILSKVHLDLIPLISNTNTYVTCDHVKSINSCSQPLFYGFKHLLRHFIHIHEGIPVNVHFSFEYEQNMLLVYMDGMVKNQISYRPNVKNKKFKVYNDVEYRNEKSDLHIAMKIISVLGGEIHNGDDSYTRAILVKIPML